MVVLCASIDKLEWVTQLYFLCLHITIIPSFLDNIKWCGIIVHETANHQMTAKFKLLQTNMAFNNEASSFVFTENISVQSGINDYMDFKI